MSVDCPECNGHGYHVVRQPDPDGPQVERLETGPDHGEWVHRCDFCSGRGTVNEEAAA